MIVYLCDGIKDVPWIMVKFFVAIPPYVMSVMGYIMSDKG